MLKKKKKKKKKQEEEQHEEGLTCITTKALTPFFSFPFSFSLPFF
jgi:hypothetical protein